MTIEKKRNVAEALADAEQQLAEHKAWLKKQIERYVLPEVRREIMIRLVDHIRLSTVKQEEFYVEKVRPISVTYEYPDDLFTYLSSADVPFELKLALAGGQVME